MVSSVLEAHFARSPLRPSLRFGQLRPRPPEKHKSLLRRKELPRQMFDL